MTTHHCKNKKTATDYAKRMRKRGYEASVHKRKNGYGVSVSRK